MKCIIIIISNAISLINNTLIANKHKACRASCALVSGGRHVNLRRESGTQQHVQWRQLSLEDYPAFYQVRFQSDSTHEYRTRNYGSSACGRNMKAGKWSCFTSMKPLSMFARRVCASDKLISREQSIHFHPASTFHFSPRRNDEEV